MRHATGHSTASNGVRSTVARHSKARATLDALLQRTSRTLPSRRTDPPGDTSGTKPPPTPRYHLHAPGVYGNLSTQVPTTLTNTGCTCRVEKNYDKWVYLFMGNNITCGFLDSVLVEATHSFVMCLRGVKRSSA